MTTTQAEYDAFQAGCDARAIASTNRLILDRYAGHNDGIPSYLRVVDWARKRYTVAGCLILSRGAAISRYSRIERLAWTRYMANRTSVAK